MIPDFDIVLVGSSPLIILEAILKSKRGFKVCILDSNQNFGGSWSYDQISSGFLIEQACHLIEPVPDIYSILESFSGVPFSVLNPQPARCLGGHIFIPYSNKLLVLLAGVRMIVKFAYLYLASLVLKNISKDLLYNYASKTTYFFRTQLPFLFSFRNFPCKAPVNGYANLIENLILNAESLGVVFRKYDVIKASFSNQTSIWTLLSEDASIISCHNLGITSSTNLRPSTPYSLDAESSIKRTRHTALFSIPSVDVITPHSYVAFSFDKYITRVSRIESPPLNQDLYYLVEMKDSYDIDFISSYVNDLFYSISLQSHPYSARLLKVKSFSYLAASSQLRADSQFPFFKVYQSFGNLACGIFQWNTKPFYI